MSESLFDHILGLLPLFEVENPQDEIKRIRTPLALFESGVPSFQAAVNQPIIQPSSRPYSVPSRYVSYLYRILFTFSRECPFFPQTLKQVRMYYLLVSSGSAPNTSVRLCFPRCLAARTLPGPKIR